MRPLVFLSLLAFATPLAAVLRLASPFSDHMVLQQEMAIPVWGWAEPGEEVTVSFGEQSKGVKAGDDGSWRIDLDPISASFDSANLTVTGQKREKIVLKDVVVGEVWICSGQSNMKFETNKVPELKALLPKARNIRSFQVPNTVAFEEQRLAKESGRRSRPRARSLLALPIFWSNRLRCRLGLFRAVGGARRLRLGCRAT